MRHESEGSTNTRLLIKTTLIRRFFDILGLIKNSLSGVNIGSSERSYDILYVRFFFDTFLITWWGGDQEVGRHTDRLARLISKVLIILKVVSGG